MILQTEESKLAKAYSKIFRQKYCKISKMTCYLLLWPCFQHPHAKSSRSQFFKYLRNFWCVANILILPIILNKYKILHNFAEYSKEFAEKLFRPLERSNIRRVYQPHVPSESYPRRKMILEHLAPKGIWTGNLRFYH